VKSVTADTQAATEPREITSADLVTALGTALSSIATGQQSVSAALTTLQSAAKAAN
jgi:hypothetical protein